MNEIRPRSFMPPSRDAVARDWHRSFVRGATATTLSQIRKTSAAEILRANWPNDRSADLIVRAPVTPLKVGDYPGSTVAKLMLLAQRVPPRNCSGWP